MSGLAVLSRCLYLCWGEEEENVTHHLLCSQRGNTIFLMWHQLQRRGSYYYPCISGDPQMMHSAPWVTCLPSLKKHHSVLRALYHPPHGPLISSVWVCLLKNFTKISPSRFLSQWLWGSGFLVWFLGALLSSLSLSCLSPWPGLPLPESMWSISLPSHFSAHPTLHNVVPLSFNCAVCSVSPQTNFLSIQNDLIFF